MKQVLIFLIIFSQVLQAGANTITAQVNNGKWSVASTWKENRTPVNGDSIIIPPGINLKVDANENLSGVVVITRGTLTFTNGKLRLDALSKVIVDFGGSITGGGNNDQITINGVFKYRGTDPDVIGYAVADNSTGNGFRMFGVLPFRFISFTASLSVNGLQLGWMYNMSPDSRYFEIQTSTDGKQWDVISRIGAKTTGAETQQYNTTLRAPGSMITYYRIVHSNNNGALLYSEVRTVGHSSLIAGEDPGFENLKAYSTGDRIMVKIPGLTSGPITVRLLNTNGQVIAQQQYDGSQLQVLLNVSKPLHGIYIVNVIRADKKTSSTRLVL